MAGQDRKTSQIIIISVLVLAVIGLFILIGSFMGPPTSQGVANNKRPTVEETIISDRTSAASPEMSWITQGRIEMERMRKDLEEQRKLLEQSRRASQNTINELTEDYDNQLLKQAQKIDQLNSKLKAAQTNAPIGTASGTQTAPRTGREQLQEMQTGNEAGSDFIRRNNDPRQVNRQSNGRPAKTQKAKNEQAGFGQSFALETSEEEESENRDVRKLANYLPAGSYAPAVVLSGADAATNVSSRENPIPVLFRITGPAVSAAVGGRGPANVNLTGCMVQGSATGDLSSERVKVRLITMTCVNRAGEVLETKVAGYIAGSGKEGVRGHVTSREGNLAGTAMVAGLIGGLGSGLNSAATSAMAADEVSTTSLLRGAAAGSLAGGVESAANTLTEYYIKRAEQYQPVVSLYGGTEVELVFLEGVELEND